VVPRGPAAPETSVGHRRVAFRRLADGANLLFDKGIAGSAVVGADVEIRQPALEKEGADRADRVAIVENGDAVHGPDVLDFGLQYPMVRFVEAQHALRRLCRVRLLAFDPERLFVEIRQWN